MPRAALPELLLALVAGRERAAAMMGDLTEIAQTRGRAWFWVAYARTLISLGWRTSGLAFILGLVCLRLMFGTVVPWVMSHGPVRNLHMAAGPFAAFRPYIRAATWNLSFRLAHCLTFGLPFVYVRFGLRNRLTQLTGVLFLIAVPVYSFRPWLMDLSGLMTALTIAVAFLFAAWRRPMIVLAATIATVLVTTPTGLQFFEILFARNFFALSGPRIAIYDAVGYAIAALVCLKLYSFLFRDPPTPSVVSPPKTHRRDPCLKSPQPKLS